MSPMCPSCQLDVSIRDARIAEMVIMNHGGSQQWLDHIRLNLSDDAQRRERQQYQFWTGTHKHKKRRGRHVHENGQWISRPRSKTVLMKKVAELEEVRDGEQKWEKRNPIHSLDEDTRQRLAGSSISSATNALERWYSHTRDTSLGKVEKKSAEFSRKRARDMEIATTPNYPDPQDFFSGRAFTLTQEQKEFIAAATLPDSNPAEYDHNFEPRKRKRRRLDANVDFDSHVYVRTEADVDLLYKSCANSSAGFLQGTTRTASLPESILRTAPRHMHPPPKRPCEVKDLKVQEKETAKTRHWRRSDTTVGHEVIDTSGFGKSWDAWDAYREVLDAGVKSTGNSIGKPDQQASHDHGLDEDELPTEREHKEAERQIQMWMQLDEEQRPVATTPPVLRADGSSPRNRRASSPGQQLRAELEAQMKRETEAVANEPARARFRPHGGMASALAIGSIVGGAALELAHKVGVL